MKEGVALFAEADQALKAGDLATYQQKTNEAKVKTERALALLNE